MEFYEISTQERATILALVARPFPADWLGQQEDMPGWWLVCREPGVAWIRNGSWAVAKLEIEGRYALRIQVLDPVASRLVHRRFGYAVAPEERQRLEKDLIVGADADAALDRLFSPRRIGIRPVGSQHRDGRELRWYRLYQSGMLGIATNAQQQIVHVEIVEGEAAFDLHEELAKR